MSVTINNLIRAIRESHTDAEDLFMEGQCWNFHKILKAVYPDAEPWYDGGHVYTKIDGRFYDVRGQVKPPPNTYVLYPDQMEDNPEKWGGRDPRRLIDINAHMKQIAQIAGGRDES